MGEVTIKGPEEAQATGSPVIGELVGAQFASPALTVCRLVEPEGNGWMMGAG
jgi:hypothetical protein